MSCSKEQTSPAKNTDMWPLLPSTIWWKGRSWFATTRVMRVIMRDSCETPCESSCETPRPPPYMPPLVASHVSPCESSCETPRGQPRRQPRGQPRGQPRAPSYMPPLEITLLPLNVARAFIKVAERMLKWIKKQDPNGTVSEQIDRENAIIIIALDGNGNVRKKKVFTF